MIEIRQFTKKDIANVIEFEKELRLQEPDTYFWEADSEYQQLLENSFDDNRFLNAVSLLAYKENKVIGRIDASMICSRSDASCCSAYLDWICVLKSERHQKVAQMMLCELRKVLNEKNVSLLIALMAENDEAKRFYQGVENAKIHDMGIWIDI